MFLKPVIIHCCVIWWDMKYCKWTCAMTTLYINIYLCRECCKTSSICLIMTTENLIWPVFFYFSVHSDPQRNIYFSADYKQYIFYAEKNMISFISFIHSKLYNELWFEPLKFRRWFRQLCTFFKIKNHGKPEYPLNKIPSSHVRFITSVLSLK